MAFPARRLALLRFLGLLEARVVEVAEVGLDVVGVGVDVGEEELGDRCLADLEFLGEAQDEGGAVAVLVFEGFPPLAGAAGGLGPVEVLGLDALELLAKALLGPVAGVADAFWRWAGGGGDGAGRRGGQRVEAELADLEIDTRKSACLKLQAWLGAASNNRRSRRRPR